MTDETTPSTPESEPQAASDETVIGLATDGARSGANAGAAVGWDITPRLGLTWALGAERQTLMRAELERMVATSGLSKDVYEQASKSLA